ncbi:hypothetical protein ACHAWF_007220 [Thalassiosira exigua]
MSAELAGLRETLRGLRSHELPATYRADGGNDDGDGDGDGDGGGKAAARVDPALLLRYKAARDEYVRQQTFDHFLNALENYDPQTNSFPLPDPSAAPDPKELERRKAEVSEGANATMDRIDGGADRVRDERRRFEEKGDELEKIVGGMEREEREGRLDGDEDENDAEGGGADESMADDEEEEEVTEEDVALQEERLEELRERRAALEARLRGVRARIADAEDDVHETKRAANEVRARGGRAPLDWRGIEGSIDGDGDNDDDGGGNSKGNGNVQFVSVEGEAEVESEIARLKGRAAELRETTESYEAMRELVEDLGGVRILSSQAAEATAGDGEEEGAQKKAKVSSADAKEGGFVLTLVLLREHVLEVTLDVRPDDKDGLRLADARFASPPRVVIEEPADDAAADAEHTAALAETVHSVSLTNASLSRILSRRPASSVPVPPLDDVVAIARTLAPSSRGVRFAVVEALARLRASAARARELTALRERYGAQAYDVERPSSAEGEGGGGARSAAVAEQEVVCALREGIAVALRLGADCPLAPGSVRVSEVFGTGGWEGEKLEELRKVVEEGRCRGPVEAMERIVSLVREGGWEVPPTPTLPGGGR